VGKVYCGEGCGEDVGIEEVEGVGTSGEGRLACQVSITCFLITVLVWAGIVTMHERKMRRTMFLCIHTCSKGIEARSENQ
jgi:hypothetical protein